MKRMLEWSTDPEGKIHVSVNSSSIDIIQTCMRKAQYALQDGHRSDETASEAQQFGKAIHTALEHYYSAAPHERTSDFVLSLIERFRLATSQLAGGAESGDKRSGTNGIKILEAYFKTYENDPWVVAEDSQGLICERDFEFTLLDSPTIHVRYHGRVDAIMKNENTGEIAVFDHKTSTTLGKEFVTRWDPNTQSVGYVLGARKAFGLDVKTFIANGIQVAKTKQDFLRVPVSYQDYHYEQFTDSVLWSVKAYLAASGNDLWPMAGGHTCTAWGGCQYIEACSAHPNSRREILVNKFLPKGPVPVDSVIEQTT